MFTNTAFFLADTHTEEVDTISETPVQSNAIQSCSPAINAAFVQSLFSMQSQRKNGYKNHEKKP